MAVERTTQMKYDEERFSVNTAWMKKGGEHIEVVIDPDAALAYKHSKGMHPDIKECLKAERVFFDAKRGLHASEEHLEKFFGTTDPLAIAKILLLEGTIQLTAEHRAKIREAKHNQILNHIRTYAIDPKTGLSHPEARLRLAFDEAKIKIDDAKTVEEQIPVIVRQLQPILPIRLETVTLQIHLPAPYGQKLYSDLQRHGQVKKADWLQDGGLLCHLELPAGLQSDLMEELGKKTHGAVDIKRAEEHRL